MCIIHPFAESSRLIGRSASLDRAACFSSGGRSQHFGDFLVIQNEHKPYTTVEHNQLASLAGAQITATLFFIVMQSTISVLRVLGFLCIVLNIILLPLVIWFNARRLKRRKDVLNAFLVEHEVEGKTGKRPSPTKHASRVNDFSDPSHFSEYWKAGHRSEFEVFCATLD